MKSALRRSKCDVQPASPQASEQIHQTNAGAKAMSNRDTETQRHGDTDDTHETEDVPPFAASVKTLQEAVQLSLTDPLNENCLFVFARAIKALEITINRRLPPVELHNIFLLWWTTAKPLLPADADFDEWRFDFEDTFTKTHAPLGSNSLQEAIRRAGASPLPPQADRYTSGLYVHCNRAGLFVSAGRAQAHCGIVGNASRAS